jgi:hypothetical protein
VHEHRHPVLAAQPLREADVVGVRVGEHERAGSRSSADPSRAGSRRACRRTRGCRHRPPSARGVLDQIEVDEIAAQPMQPLGDARHFCLTISERPRERCLEQGAHVARRQLQASDRDRGPAEEVERARVGAERDAELVLGRAGRRQLGEPSTGRR